MAILFLANLAPDAREEWRDALGAALPGEAITAWSPCVEASVPPPSAIAVVAAPPPGLLARVAGLRFVQSAWAGVDGLLADPTLPAVPLARLVDPMLAADMAEAVLGHVMALHRRMADYRAQQRAQVWQPLPQPRMGERRVGVLGMGAMGAASAQLLARTGFAVTGWSGSGRSAAAGMAMEAGAAGLARVLAGSDILVNLLPLTAGTRGILDAAAFARMPRGAGLVNAGRGGHVVVPDLCAALDAGQIGHAVLDVFETEPLPPHDPLWARDDVTITPHVAAPTDPRSAALAIAANIAAFRAGRPLAGLVDRVRGY